MKKTYKHYWYANGKSNKDLFLEQQKKFASGRSKFKSLFK